jgi:hypothetical protein
VLPLATWSLGLAVLGLAASRWGAAALARRAPHARARAAWIAGLPALLPAWLVPFVSLLGAAGAEGGPPRVTFLAASATAILGVLASDALLGREERRGEAARPVRCWLLGAAALLPAWVAALALAARVAR